MLNFIYRILLGLLALPSMTMAAHSQGIGGVASNLLEPVDLLSSFVGVASIVIGSTCLFSALLRYLQHRVNPYATPISTVIVLLVLGTILVLLPFAYKLTESGIPFGVRHF